MSIWSELNGSVTFHEKDHVSIKAVFDDVVWLRMLVFVYRTKS